MPSSRPNGGEKANVWAVQKPPQPWRPRASREYSLCMAGFWLLFSSHLSLKWSLFTESGDEYQKSVKKRSWTIEQNLWKMCRLPLDIVQRLNEKLFSMFLSSFNFSPANTHVYIPVELLYNEIYVHVYNITYILVLGIINQ